MAFLYPWGNTQQLNLDWILQKIKELEAGSGGADLDEVAEALLAASYSAQAYNQFDIVFHDGKLYLANTDIAAPGEAWTPAHWDEIVLGGPVSALMQHVSNLDSDNVINDSQVTGDTVSDALDTLKNAIDAISLDSDSISNESTVAGDTVSDALDNLSGDISTVAGDVSTVQTTLSTLANAHYATLGDESYTGQLRAQKYLHTIVISGNVNVGSTGIAGQLVVIATLANQELPDPGTSSTVWGYGTYNGSVGFIQFELQANGNLRSRHGSGTITGNIQFPNATTFG